MATGAAWLKGRNSQGGREEQKHAYRKKKRKNTLDSYRTSHGRSWQEALNISFSLRFLMDSCLGAATEMTDNEASQWIKEILSLFSVVAGLDVMSRTRIS